MNVDPKQRNQRNRRRERAARMQKEAAHGRHRGDSGSGEEEDGEDVREKRPPNRKKRNKEPVFEEDFIDGFAILSFKTYEDLENSIIPFEKPRVSPEPVLSSEPRSDIEIERKPLQVNNIINNQINSQRNTEEKIHVRYNDTTATNEKNSRTSEVVNGPQRSASRDRLSDASSRTSSGRGYMCDSESEEERGSDAESDIFHSTVLKRESPNHLGANPSQAVNRSPPPQFVPPPPSHPVQNGPLHPEPSAAVAAVTATASATNPLTAGVASSPQEPPACSPSPVLSSISPPGGALLHSQSQFHQKESPVSITQFIPKEPAVPITQFLQKDTPVPINQYLQKDPPLPINQYHQRKDSPLPINQYHQKKESPLPINQYHQRKDNSVPIAHAQYLQKEPPLPITQFLQKKEPSLPISQFLQKEPPIPQFLQKDPPVPVTQCLQKKDPIVPITQFLQKNEPPVPINQSAHRKDSPIIASHFGPKKEPVVTSSSRENNQLKSYTNNGLCKSNGPNFLPTHCAPPTSHYPSHPVYPPAVTTVANNGKSNTVLHTSPCVSSGQPPPALPDRHSVYSFPYSHHHHHPYTQELPSPEKTSSVPLISPLSSSAPSVPTVTLSSSSSSSPSPAAITPQNSNRLPISSAPSSHTFSHLQNITADPTLHPNTPTPTHGRDSYSSHSNSSLSSLSQLSQTVHSAGSHKEVIREREGTCSRSRSSGSRNATPSVTSSTIPCCTYSATYGASNSLTSLVFSKPSCWTSSSTNPILSTANGPHITPPLSSRPTPTSPNPNTLSLPSVLHNSHHSSSFAAHPPPPPTALHPGAPHPGMFAPSIPHPSSLTSSNLSIGRSANHSSYGGDSLFAHSNQDLLRRELDTRFLASQDRTINIPPPPYMRTEMHQHQHQHQHTHMHQHSPFLHPPLGGALVPQPTSHLYDKFPKLDSSFYGRNALGLPGYHGISPLLAPGAAGAGATPFAPPGHLAAFQPKMNTLVKSKSMKSGRWCAMHVRIAWEIYHHQQKQQHSEVHKPGAPSTAVAAAAAKPTPDILRSPNHLFPSLPRPHDLSFSSSFLGAAAASAHSRTHFDASAHHNSFLSPTAAHLGVSPFARPGFPGFGTPGGGFGGLGTIAGLGASMFGNRELGAGCLTASQDPWSHLHRATATFPTPTSASAIPWGGLKAEAERDRLQREDSEREREKEREHREREREREKQRKAEAEKEKREKEAERSSVGRESRDKKEERQKERDRESRGFTHVNSIESVRNGDLMPERSREKEKEKEWDRARERRESSRSPIRVTREIINTNPKVDSAFESSSSNSNSKDVKVKEERKEDETSPVVQDLATPHIVSASSVNNSGSLERSRVIEPTRLDGGQSDSLPRTSLPVTVGSLERPRVMGPLGLGHVGLASDRPPHCQVSHFWGPLAPPTTTSSSTDHYRHLDFHQIRDVDREQLIQRYGALSSVMPLPHDRFRDAEFARQLAISANEASARDMDRHLQMDRERQAYERSKLPPPLRPNDPPYVPPPGLPSATLTGGIFPSLTNPYLNSICGPAVGSRNKSTSPGSSGNGIPPPLIPCTGPGGIGGSSSLANHTGHHSNSSSSPIHQKTGSVVENSHEAYFSKDRRDVSSHPTEVESQSR